MELISKKNKVEKLLKKHPYLRDNDNRLIANIWFQESKEKELESRYFLRDFSQGKYSNPESIRRIRQKLQEEFPNLRGEKWFQRHKEQENVKKQLFETPELYPGGTP